MKLTTITIHSVKPDNDAIADGRTEAASGASATVDQDDIDALAAIAASGGVSAGIPIKVSLSASSDNACQGATFTVHFTATAESSN